MSATTFPRDPKCPAEPGVTLTLADAASLADLSLLVAMMRPAGVTPKEWREWNRVTRILEDAVAKAKAKAQ